MSYAVIPETAMLDELNTRIVRALQLSPRAPFRRIATALEVSEQTVARRYRAMQRDGLVRVIGIVDPVALGESDWVVRVQCRPEATVDLGRALAQRPDVGWVSLVSGGSEVVCFVRSQSQREREQLLLDRLPRSAAVLRTSAAVVLRRFLGDDAADWLSGPVLTAAQESAIRHDDPPPRHAIDRNTTLAPASLGPADHAMLAALTADGRASVGDLARATGLSEGRVTRRLESLLTSGVLYLDVDLVPASFGFRSTAYVWLTVEPARLDDACRTLADYPETPFVAAVSGRFNVVSAVMTRNLDELYTFITERVGRIEGVQAVDVEPIVRRLKQAGSRLEDDRLAPYGPSSVPAVPTSRRAGRVGRRTR